MSNLVIIYENFSDLGTLSAGNWLASLPLTNMQDPDIQRVARSANATSDATLFRIDLGVDRPVDGIAFGPANLSPGATWQLRAFQDENYSDSPILYDSGTQTVTGSTINWADPQDWLEWEDPGFWLGISSLVTIDALPQFNFHIIPVNQGLARFWQLEIFDDANADGFIEIGRLLIGRAFRPSSNYSEDNRLSLEPMTDANVALGGKTTYWERGIRRTFRCAFPNLTEDEGFGDVMRMSLEAGVSGQIFVVPDPADATFYTRRAFLATMREVPAVQQLLIDRSSINIDLVEVL